MLQGIDEDPPVEFGGAFVREPLVVRATEARHAEAAQEKGLFDGADSEALIVGIAVARLLRHVGDTRREAPAP